MQSLRDEYQIILNGVLHLGYFEKVEHIKNSLPYLWVEQYATSSNHQKNVCKIKLQNFEYIFDHIVENSTDDNAFPIEPRLIAAFGLSSKVMRKRDDSRLKAG